jgi:hypothetical protein
MLLLAAAVYDVGVMQETTTPYCASKLPLHATGCPPGSFKACDQDQPLISGPLDKLVIHLRHNPTQRRNVLSVVGCVDWHRVWVGGVFTH